MLKRIGQTITKGLGVVLIRLQHSVRPALRIKLMRRYLCLSLPPRLGGEFYLLPTKEFAGPVRFTVALEGQHFILQMINATGSRITLAHFPNELTARLALAKLRQKLSQKCLMKWFWRFSLLCLVGWWFNTYATHTHSKSALLADRPFNAASLSTTPLQSSTASANIDKPTLQAEELAGNLSQQIIAAQANAKSRLASPDKPLPAPYPALPNLGTTTEASQTSTGCDPKFAFDEP